MPEDKVILVMGDSLSAGYGIRSGQGWVTLLQEKLEKLGYGYKVANASISGDTTRGGVSRLPKTLEREKPAVVIIELGANDGLRGLNLNDMGSNLESMILESRKFGASVLLLGMELPANYGQPYRQKFHDIYAQIKRKHKVPLVPFFLQGVAETRQLMQADGLHPVAAAQPRILENIWPQLQPLLEK